MLLGAMPTITPPMWATLATGCYPMTHGITDYNVRVEKDPDITQEAFMSKFLKAGLYGMSLLKQARKRWCGTGRAALGLQPPQILI